MGKGPEQILPQGGHIKGPEAYERMLGITSHQRDENQNHSETPLVRRAIKTKSTNNKCWRGCREKENPSALLVGMQSGAATVENSMEFPQKTKHGTAF